MIEITETVARKVLEVVDAGLIDGVGKPIPGQMCVEAAVCYALDLPHGDDPACVSRALRSLKIRLNDSKWSSNEARAKGLRRLAVAQLGSRDHLDDKEFTRRVSILAIQVSVPIALRAAASIHKDSNHQQALRDAANRCEADPTRANALDANKIARAAYAADASAYAAYASYAASSAASASYAASAAASYAADAAAYAASAAAYAAYAAYASYAASSAASASYAASAAADADAAAYAASAAASSAASASYAASASASADAAAYAASAAAYAADADAADADGRDKLLADFAEGAVQILIEMNAPGCQWLALTEMA